MEINLTKVNAHVIDLSRIDDSSVIVDAGACVGEFIQNIRRYEQAKRCKIIAIECNFENVDILKTLNFPNVTVCERALTGQNYGDETEFYHHEGLVQWGNIIKFFPTQTARTKNPRRLVAYKVKTLKINDIFSELGIDRIDYLKVDIEGAEADLMKTMTKETASRIEQIYVESHLSHKSITASEIEQRLIELDYNISQLAEKLDRYGSLTKKEKA